MKPTKFFLLFALAVTLISCEKEVTVESQIIVKRLNLTSSPDEIEPIADIPVSIYLNSSGEDRPLNQQKLVYSCKTDKNGYYQFAVTESEYSNLEKFNAYVIRKTAFDSTKTEWQFFTDSTYFKLFNITNQTYFSKIEGGSFEQNISLIPAGWVYFKFENLIHNSLLIGVRNEYSPYLKGLSSSSNAFYLHPSREHEVIIRNGDGGSVLGTISLYVRNSFVRTSRPWHENLRPDTVVVDMSTMNYRIVRANLEN
jgi:hypothetical protein